MSYLIKHCVCGDDWFNRLCSRWQLHVLCCVCVFPVVDWCVWGLPLGAVSSAFRRTAGDFLAEDPSLCFSLRENEDQRQLLCNDRRSNFNYNPLSLRFGKRYNGYIYRRAVKRARTKKVSPFSLFLRELEVPTWNRGHELGNYVICGGKSNGDSSVLKTLYLKKVSLIKTFAPIFNVKLFSDATMERRTM